MKEKGISLAIRTVVILIISILILLAVITMFTDVWDVSPFEDTKGNISEEYGPDWGNGEENGQESYNTFSLSSLSETTHSLSSL